MSLSSEDLRSKAYYDEFSKRYDDERGGRVRGGYHDLLDELEVSLVERYGREKDVLEVGCGTGLLLEQFARFARSAKGVDLSEGMLAKATARGLDATLGSATELPFDAETFDVACSFKVLAHVPDIDRALSEMVRVVRPGGHVLAEFYNPHSFRALTKRLFGPQAVGRAIKEDAVFTRFDTPEEVARRTPSGCNLVGVRGIRIVTPVASAMKVPVLRDALGWAERRLADGPLARFAGFYVAIWQKA